MYHSHDIHLISAKRILNFIQGTKTHWIHYVAQSSLELVGFTDSDWAGDKLIGNQLLDMFLYLHMDQSSGQVRSKVQLHFHPHRQNIEEK